MSKLFFCYGTLKRDGSRASYLAQSRYLGIARTEPGFILYTPPGGGYPAMVSQSTVDEDTDDIRGKWKGTPGVWGELYEVSEEQMTVLDRVEGAPTLYDRGKVTINSVHLVNMPDSPEVLQSLEDRAAVAYFYQRDISHLKPLGSFWRNK